MSGLLPPGTQFDLFRGTAAMKQDVDDLYPTTLSHTIKARNTCVANLIFVWTQFHLSFIGSGMYKVYIANHVAFLVMGTEFCFKLDLKNGDYTKQSM